jgi:ATP-dependent RNA circularization protein (DNA/RNA ligase family)
MFRKYEKTYRLLVPQYPEVKGKDHYLNKKEARALMTGKLVVTEKMDGSNVGVIGTAGDPVLQKRASLVDASEHNQYNLFKAWAQTKNKVLRALPKKWIVYGELMFTVHTIQYDKLPDWFLVFAIWDGQEYMPWKEMIKSTKAAGLHTVPFIAEGYFDRATIVDELMPKMSAYGNEEAEGIVVYNYKKQMRGKIVKPEFVKRHTHNTKWTSTGQNKLLKLGPIDLRYNPLSTDEDICYFPKYDIGDSLEDEQ